MKKTQKISEKSRENLMEKVEGRTLSYEYVMAMTNVVLAISVFVGLIISIFPLISVEKNILGIKLELVVIFFFVLGLGIVLYFTHRMLRI